MKIRETGFSGSKNYSALGCQLDRVVTAFSSRSHYKILGVFGFGFGKAIKYTDHWL